MHFGSRMILSHLFGGDKAILKKWRGTHKLGRVGFIQVGALRVRSQLPNSTMPFCVAAGEAFS